MASTPGRLCRQLGLESIAEEAEFDDQLAQLADLDNRLQALCTPEAGKKKPAGTVIDTPKAVAMPAATEMPEGDKKPAATETPKKAMKAQLDEWKALEATSLASPFVSLPSDTGLQSPFERIRPGKKRRLIEAPTPNELGAKRPGKKCREAPAEPPRRRKSRRILNKKQK